MIGIYLMSKKGFLALSGLIDNRLQDQISYVCIGRDKAVLNDYANEIFELCRNNSIKTFERSDVIDIKSDVVIAISWRWLISTKAKVIVFHDSLLPKYRGFAPLVNCLINGETKIGLTVLLATEEYDKGDIIDQRAIEIKYPLKIESAIDMVSELYKDLLIKVVNDIKTNNIKQVKQDEDQATYSLWLDDDDYKINWNQDAMQIKRFIDAVGYPYNGARTVVSGKTVVIDDSIVMKDLRIENRTPGKIIMYHEGYPVVVCGTGLLKITKARYTNGENVFPTKKFRVRLA